MRISNLLTSACFLLLAVSAAQAAGRAENHFASVYVDGKKAGQIQYTIQYDENGDVERLQTRVSRSILGVRVFNFDQTVREEWRSSGLHEMRSRTDDDGKIHEASVGPGSGVYKGVLDGKSIELPGEAFPASVWHYAIVRQSLLFDLMALKLMRVKIARFPHTLSIGTKKIAAERFDFSGDWQATVWFDQRHQLVQFKYPIDGHDVEVRLDE